ncbi:MAG: hypothetical protein GY923_12035 [Aestuariibacter sp.]|jgi:hypothetical protein|nr:hypothetical protein [Aestuariibacter sp.]MCP4948217.1 hypothetical protein [Aestuariibacter sp.]
MTIVTPSSLKWLINQYQSRQRQVREIEEHIYALLLEKQKILAELEPLAKVIEIHEIPIFANDTPNLRSKGKHSGLPYGELTRQIYQYLRSTVAERDATVTEIFYHCSQALDANELSDVSRKLLLKSVRKQLRNLAYKGRIEMTFAGTNFVDSRYRAKKRK